MKEFKIVLFLSIIWPTLLAIPIYFEDSSFFINYPFFQILLIIIWYLMIIFCIIWISFLTAGSLLFDNIPTVWDILWYMDYSEWSWLEKLKGLSKVWSIKNNLQNKLNDFFIITFLKLTVHSFGLSIYYFKDTIRALFKLDYERFFKSLIKGYFILITPIFVWFLVWWLWLIWYMRINLTRLPIILMWFILLVLVWFIVQSINNGIAIFLSMICIIIWYCYLFLEIEDLLTVKVIYQLLFEKIKGK